jgi:beta-lactamase superfamily II metal-dependent hydrolase
MKFDLHVLQAMSGDSLLLSYIGNDNKEHNILIDGGMPNTFKKIIRVIDDEDNNENEIKTIDYVFLTHIDRDHIGGILKLLDSSYASKIKKVFFNSGHMIYQQESSFISESDGIDLIKQINKSDGLKANREEITISTECDFFGLEMTFLSPTYEALNNFNKLTSLPEVEEESFISESEEIREDINLSLLAQKKFYEKKLERDPSNGVSLAMFIKYQDISILLLGDAKDSVLIPVLEYKGYTNNNKLQVDYMKLSHHGSKYHTTNDFLELIDCQHFIISANGTNKHPNIETLARILCHEERDKSKTIYFYFNYEEEDYKNKGIYLLNSTEQVKYNCKCIYNKTLFDLVG